MNKLNKESEAYFVKMGSTVIFHYDCNSDHYYRKGVECGEIDVTIPNKSEIRTIIIDPLFVNFKPAYYINWFFNLGNLERIIGLEYLNTI